jgi:hypothetical protein
LGNALGPEESASITPFPKVSRVSRRTTALRAIHQEKPTGKTAGATRAWGRTLDGWLNSPARALSHPPRRQTGSLGCPNAAPEHVHGAIRAPFLHRKRGLVQKARALSHYSGDAS